MMIDDDSGAPSADVPTLALELVLTVDTSSHVSPTHDIVPVIV
jgi:hypothetical protein